VSETVKSQVVWYAVEIASSDDEELRTRTRRVGILALYEGPPLRADDGRGEGKNVRGRVYGIALDHMSATGYAHDWLISAL
jgi:hypothetical protein